MSKDRTSYNPRIIQENNERELKYFHIYAHFRPNVWEIPVTGKFYSPHEEQDLSQADEELLYKVKKCRELIPPQKYPAPVAESHVYGWIPGLLTDIPRKDRRYFQPKVNSISYLYEVSGFMKKRGV